MKPFTSTALYGWLEPIASLLVRPFGWADPERAALNTQIVSALLVFFITCQGIPWLLTALMGSDPLIADTSFLATGLHVVQLYVSLWAGWYGLKGLFTLVGYEDGSVFSWTAAGMSCFVVGLLSVGNGVRDWFFQGSPPGILVLTVLVIGWVVSCLWPTWSKHINTK